MCIAAAEWDIVRPGLNLDPAGFWNKYENKQSLFR